MSQENVEIVRRCYESDFWTTRDLSLFPELAHSDVEIDLSRNIFNPGIHQGFDGFRRMVEQIDEMWEDFQIELEELVDCGDQVVAGVRISGRGRGSGVETEMQLFAIWTLRDGKVSRMTGGYRERAEALEAAGLSE
jgi:ketosteroid isomerase-like protein